MKNITSKQDVIERLCRLVSHVGDKRFNNELAHDCFCGLNNLQSEKYFKVDEDVIVFIENAVQEKINEHSQSQNSQDN